jgi:UDP-N-acetylmuramoyl-tripeptide--D-alanyl-D-alanine ligase
MSVALEQAIAAMRAATRHFERLPAALRVCTDTRILKPGDTFLALRGERFDGHTFVRDAFAAGAAAAVTAEGTALPEDAPGFIVEDTTRAYMALAGAARRALKARVVAVTGSAGKTTTTALIGQLAQRAGLGKVVATPGNENNEIGVSKLLLGIESDADVAVIELAARRYGEIAPLAQIAAPDVAVLTNIGEAHLEIMGSRERLAETKFGIFVCDAVAILNMFDGDSRERAPSLRKAPYWFGYAPVESMLSALSAQRTLPVIQERTTMLVGRKRFFFGERLLETKIALPGEHNLANLAAAVAAVRALGAGDEAILAGLPDLTLPPRRYERLRVGDIDFIFDAYNASMSGTLATLGSFSREPALRRIAVLGGMAELGEESPAMHERVGEAAARSGLHRLLISGQYAGDLERGARATGLAAEEIVRFERNEDAGAWLRANTRPGDVVLLKGSRMYRLEEIVEDLSGPQE